MGPLFRVLLLALSLALANAAEDGQMRKPLLCVYRFCCLLARPLPAWRLSLSLPFLSFLVVFAIGTSGKATLTSA